MANAEQNKTGLLQLPSELLYQICECVDRNSPADSARLARAACHRLKDMCFEILMRNNTRKALRWALGTAVLGPQEAVERTTKLIRQCVHHGDADALFERYASGFTTERFGLLNYAAYMGDMDLARELLQKGLHVDAANGRPGANRGFTPLIDAIARGHRDMVRMLLEHGASLQLECRHVAGFHAVHALASRAEPDYLEEMVQELNLDINHRSAAGMTPLLYACADVQGARNIETLLRLGAHLEASNGRGNTALHLLVGTLEDVETTFGPGNAIVTMRERDEAVESGIRTLLAAGAGIDTLNHDGQSPLGYAAFKGDMHLLQVLLRHGADVNAGASSPAEQDTSAAMDTRPLFLLLKFQRSRCESAWHQDFNRKAAGCCRDLMARGAHLDKRVAPLMLESSLGAMYDVLDSLTSRFGFDVVQAGMSFECLIISTWEPEHTDVNLTYMLDRFLPDDDQVLDDWALDSLIFSSCAVGLPGILRLIGPNFNPRTNNTHPHSTLIGTPLHCLLENPSFDYSASPYALDFLLERGADVNARDEHGILCLSTLLTRGFHAVRALLFCRDEVEDDATRASGPSEHEMGGESSPDAEKSLEEYLTIFECNFGRIVDEFLKHGLNLDLLSWNRENQRYETYLQSIANSGVAPCFARCASYLTESQNRTPSSSV
ncbi:hypothetical protein G6O67_004892 [Ophiocordyceps sinensis]|uniref:Ankyrin repeat-containing domain protein n=1 Tax=Ophiocordyceps sinensis TaxID=72228 RepID=A0A8H4PQD0_9HYPO|nr:hypothetical protein G6O67_004892 [Ophiocordyceps sinensis]